MLSAFNKKIENLPLVVCEQSLKHDVDDIVSGLWPGMKLAIVDDANTAAAAGDNIFKALKSAAPCVHLTFDKAAHANDQSSRWLEDESKGADALVAVGSGSINDLCKYVSHKTGKPYLVVPTAASMNGYVSANASISVQGYKHTMPAHMPAAVLCDMGIIATAPERLNKSGLGDSLARSTAQADWRLSNLLLGTAYDESVYSPLLRIEGELLACARGIAKADKKSLELLIKTLLLSGAGMTAAHGSYPASQAEHMIAHTYGMMKWTQPLPRTFHGEEIGVTTLTMARMQQSLLQKIASLRTHDFDEGYLKKNFGNKIAKEASDQFDKKHMLLESRGIEMTDWPAVAGQIEQVTLSPDRLLRVLEEVEAPTSPEMLGWNPMHYTEAQHTARYMRDRFTFLDLV